MQELDDVTVAGLIGDVSVPMEYIAKMCNICMFNGVERTGHDLCQVVRHHLFC